MGADLPLFLLPTCAPHPHSSHSSLCKLQFLTNPCFWVLVLIIPTHPTPAGLIPDLKITTKQVGEFKSN